MGRGSGLGGLIAVLGLALLFSKPRERIVTIGGVSPTVYYEYRRWATDPQAPTEELVTHEAHEGDLTTEGTWRTINGKIPTPAGKLIPVPGPWPGGVVDVNEMLKSVDEEPPDIVEDPEGPISVNLRLKPVV